MAEKKFYVWNRPQVPDANQGAGMPFSAVAFFGGLIGLVMSSDEYASIELRTAATAAMALGLTGMIVCSVLREIRQMAFEAALRAGEVELADKPVPFPNAQGPRRK